MTAGTGARTPPPSLPSQTPLPSRRVDRPTAEHVAAELDRRAGLRFADHNLPDLAGALEEAMDAFACATSSDLLAAMSSEENGRALLDWLFQRVTIGETYFFREPAQFEALRGEILPDLVARRAALGTPFIRAWSAGCATGEEAYSIAMTLLDCVPPGQRWGVTVIGSDINRKFLARAREAVYGPWSLRGVDEATRDRFFVSSPGPDGVARFAPREEVRRLVTFQPLNLREVDYPSLQRGLGFFDVVFCRNVFIYFEPEIAAMVAARLGACLVEGGHVFFGASDPVPGGLPGLRRREIGGAVAFQRARSAEASARTEGATEPRGSGGAQPAAPRSARRRHAPRPAIEVPGPATVRAADCRTKARAHADRGELVPARGWAERWMAADAGSAAAAWFLGMVDFQLGDRPRARASLRRCLCLDPAFALAHFVLSEIDASEGRARAAARGIQHALELLEGRADGELLGDSEVTAGWLRRVLEERAGRRRRT